MSDTDTIRSIETFIVRISRETPYLGPLRAGERVNRAGYIVRRGNRTLYPAEDRSVLVKVTAESGAVGWGETYGIVAPRAVTEIIRDVIAPALEGFAADAPAAAHDMLYDLMRVRGFWSGFWTDALAAIDIALWDLLGRKLDVPLSTLLGGRRHPTLPAYVSGLPAARLRDRCDMALRFRDQGFLAVKFAAAVADDGPVAEIAALREALGAEPKIMADLHWQYTAAEAIATIKAMAPHGLAFAEAPCAPEDILGQAEVARAAGVPIALGEELRGAFEWLPRLRHRCMSIAQPEMARTGVTEFMRIAALCHAHHVAIVPHATVGVGIFLAASLHCASVCAHVPWHEYQHSVFDRHLGLIETDMACAAGSYAVPTGPGLGVVPAAGLFDHVVQ
jgi:L-alanine-DL-glutamate epimerase-like enolase superfamily enzyme